MQIEVSAMGMHIRKLVSSCIERLKRSTDHAATMSNSRRVTALSIASQAGR